VSVLPVSLDPVSELELPLLLVSEELVSPLLVSDELLLPGVVAVVLVVLVVEVDLATVPEGIVALVPTVSGGTSSVADALLPLPPQADRPPAIAMPLARASSALVRCVPRSTSKGRPP
jgi:hypothetical protein